MPFHTACLLPQPRLLPHAFLYFLKQINVQARGVISEFCLCIRNSNNLLSPHLRHMLLKQLDNTKHEFVRHQYQSEELASGQE
jgi:hypothetical protein